MAGDRLHPRLAQLRSEIEDINARAERLGNALDDAAFARRPANGGWSPGECIAHLNLTTKAFLPLIDGALAGAPRVPVDPSRRYRKDFMGWLLVKVMEPPARMKVKTPPPFVPQLSGNRREVLREFETLQAELARRVENANGHDIGRVKVRSPFSARVSYNLLGGFSGILAHERRHLWQAERAAGMEVSA